MNAHSRDRIQALGELLTETCYRLEEEKECSKILKKSIMAAREASGDKVGWWEAQMDKLLGPSSEVFRICGAVL